MKPPLPDETVLIGPANDHASHTDGQLQRFLGGVACAEEGLIAHAFSLEFLRERLSEDDLDRFVTVCRRLEFVRLNF